MSDANEAWEKWWRSTFFPREQWSQFQTAYKAGFTAGQVAALEDAAKELHRTNALCYPEWLAARAAELSKETP